MDAVVPFVPDEEIPCKCIRFWQSEQDMRNRVTASRGRNAYISATCTWGCRRGIRQHLYISYSLIYVNVWLQRILSINSGAFIFPEMHLILHCIRSNSIQAATHRSVCSFLSSMFARSTIHFDMNVIYYIVKVFNDCNSFINIFIGFSVGFRRWGAIRSRSLKMIELWF